MENLTLLKKIGVKTLFLEHLFTEAHQGLLDKYLTNKDKPMPSILKGHLSYIDAMFFSKTKKSCNFTFTKLVEACITQGIRVVAIDSFPVYSTFQGFITNNNSDINRIKTMNHLAYKIVNQHAKNALWIMLCGSAHATKYREIPGIAQLFGLPSVVIKEQGNSKIAITSNYQKELPIDYLIIMPENRLAKDKEGG